MAWFVVFAYRYQLKAASFLRKRKVLPIYNSFPLSSAAPLFSRGPVQLHTFPWCVSYISGCFDISPATHYSPPIPGHFTMSSSAHFPDSSSFQHQSDQFVSWLESIPGVKVNSNILLADLRSKAAGRGVGKHSLPAQHTVSTVCVFAQNVPWQKSNPALTHYFLLL